MKARVPDWPLDRVRGLVAEGKVWVQITRALQFFETREAAYHAVKVTVAALTAKSFASLADERRRGETKGLAAARARKPTGPLMADSEHLSWNCEA